MKLGIFASLFLTGMLFYVVWRTGKILHFHIARYWIFGIALLFSLGIIAVTLYSGENVVFNILGTFGSWFLIFTVLLFGYLIVEHILHHWIVIHPGIIFGIFFGIIGLGVFFALHTKITELTIRSPKIGDNKTVLFVSDIHIDYLFSTYHLKTIEKTVKNLHPDLIVIAGDLMNKPHRGYLSSFDYFKKEAFKDIPIYAIEGNHDIISNSNIIHELAQNSSIHFLFDQEVNIDNINLVGILDKTDRGSLSLDDHLVKSNIYQGDSSLFTILLTHQPISLEKLQQYPIDLELAGHTHRGQFFGIRKIVEWLNDYVYGKYTLGDQNAFVSQGLGTRGLPFRLGTQSEIVVIHLQHV